MLQPKCVIGHKKTKQIAGNERQIINTFIDRLKMPDNSIVSSRINLKSIG